MTPPTSLILCSRNRPDMLAETVEGILAGEALPSELIIVDQSDAPHPELERHGTVRGCEVRYHWSTARGLSRANNDGIDLARHDLLLFTHDDVRVAPDWLATLARAVADGGPRAVISGQVLPEAENGGDGFVPSTKVDERPRVYEGRTPEGVLYPMNMGLHRAAFDEVGTFDERLGPGTPFPAAEDNDLCHRLLEAGYRVIYDPTVILHHRAWRPERDYLPLRWGYGRGQGAFYAKHFSMRDRFVLRQMLWEAQHRARRMVRTLVRQPRRALGQAAYLAGVASGFVTWWLGGHGRRPEHPRRSPADSA